MNTYLIIKSFDNSKLTYFSFTNDLYTIATKKYYWNIDKKTYNKIIIVLYEKYKYSFSDKFNIIDINIEILKNNIIQIIRKFKIDNLKRKI